jgi:DNA-damage-inducible protein J
VKQQAEDMLNEIGLNMTTYINSSLRALVREKKVPFELTTKQQTNAEYLAKLDESIAQAERGEVVRYTMEELKALVNGE